VLDPPALLDDRVARVHEGTHQHPLNIDPHSGSAVQFHSMAYTLEVTRVERVCPANRRDPRLQLDPSNGTSPPSIANYSSLQRMAAESGLDPTKEVLQLHSITPLPF
jgi:hypothetical protein